ncbi:2-oxo acid dehydrogenase acyltransferase (catalytic domain) [Capnocytophaga ochracea F0287]|uniref:Dihydrolipoamide acetyltransferase component of pyruvate dehydrogenase complex n=1 Tax=Capnocytophaga ochracea F0287 TaxID=873517 RepID=E4MR89_CAPOC|nr:dihydrolipoamide acetyltransferase family protein [Capnocytophaga ochracea]EFS97804.1 2-oxo acid dehydrogenase acyltransferase (catalytic domain) [Capnocytophaga ochracea F0287]EJF45822.1 putative lipoamide acyltransferase component of branched-chain alpha-keto acid dehydrogenase complex [Capnocytophaga ochracea str. Holt 25]UEB43896.1 2-oxo acid dehydrogenase subunit E2 [Capnocytophaga ochracea]
MARYELIFPSLGESVTEAVVTNWLKKVGDPVEAEESIVEVSTDKVDTEVPTDVSGILAEIKFQVNDVVKVGEVIAVIETQEEISTSGEALDVVQQSVASLEKNIANIQQSTSAQPQIDFSKTERFYSPLVKNIAKKEGISLSELDSIKGTGLNDRVTKSDILDYLSHRTQGKAKPSATFDATPADKRVYTKRGEERIEMSRMGKLIAEHMLKSKVTSAHVQSFIEVDVTRIWKWRNKVKKAFEEREGEKFTFTPIFMEVVAKALVDFPMMNVSVEGDSIIKKRNINIGMATALSDGNLIVPVIKNADELSLRGMAKVVNDLANRARANALKPDEVKDGTYTVTNIGSFGTLFGTPIINQPQVGILAIGAIQKVPAVIETPEGDTIGIRYKLMLSHSYDHRVVNGALGGMFVQRVAKYLEEWDMNRVL